MALNKNLKRKILESINTDDSDEKDKIYKIICYYLEEMSKTTNNKDITRKINQICTMSDLDKIKAVYYDKELDNLKAYSGEIFEKTISFINNRNNGINQEEYDKYMLKLKLFRFKISDLFKAEVDFIYSECALDLNFLLKKKGLEAYSIRISNYMKKHNFMLQ